MPRIPFVLLLTLSIASLSIDVIPAQIVIAHVDVPAVMEAMPEMERARLGLREYARFQEFQLRTEIEIVTQTVLARARKFPSNDGGLAQATIANRVWSLRDSAYSSVFAMKIAMLDLIQVRFQEALRAVAARHGVVMIFNGSSTRGYFTQPIDPFEQIWNNATWTWIPDDSLGIPVPRISGPSTDVLFASEATIDLTEEVIAWLSRREE